MPPSILVENLRFRYSSEVEVRGFSLPDQARELKQRIGYVPEAAELYETLSAREFLELCGRLHDLEDSSLFPRIDALLEAFELTDHGHSEHNPDVTTQHSLRLLDAKARHALGRQGGGPAELFETAAP